MEILSFCILVLSLVVLAAAQRTTVPSEVAAMRKLVDYWNLGTKLNLTVDPCSQSAPWAPEEANPRIACDCAGNVCHITHLKIYALDISGEIPQELFQLTELVDLTLGQNILSGPIPLEIGQLSKMQWMSFGINNLSGLVPEELGNLTKLKSLAFGSNNFHGPLPASLGNLTDLEQLYIDSSGVEGPIPKELSNLKSLQTLWASDNRFTGKLPEFFGTLTNLTTLRLEGTALEGPIPSSYSALTKLSDLRISELRNEDSTLDFIVNMTSLSILSLRNCRLVGEIPVPLGNFAQLKSLDLSFNKLTGSIPNSFQDFTLLQFLYLGSNNLTGALPPHIVTPKLNALDVSFNPITGNLPVNFAKAEFSMNIIGTSINANALLDGKMSTMRCLSGDTNCSNKVPFTSFAVKCGGTEQVSSAGTKFDDDSEVLTASSMYVSSKNQWAVSNTGYFISNPNGPQYTTQTESQITDTLESELYKSARISPSSLRYYGLGLKNGKYNIELHFAEIQMDDTRLSWKGLGRRLFDVYIQGEKVLQDFNIKKETRGSKRALVMTFEANVTNTVMDIHFFWAGKGTCCIPFQSTYGPLVSAIHVSQVSDGGGSSNHDKRRVGKIVGIALGGAAGLIIAASVFYLWRTKETPGHMRVHTDSPKKGLTSF